MYTIQTKIALARAFSAKLQEDLTASQVRQMIDLNKCEASDSICHSHDFCDANMPMSDAFEAIVGRQIDMDADADLDLWNDAWAIAKAADFFI